MGIIIKFVPSLQRKTRLLEKRNLLQFLENFRVLHHHSPSTRIYLTAHGTLTFLNETVKDGLQQPRSTAERNVKTSYKISYNMKRDFFLIFIRRSHFLQSNKNIFKMSSRITKFTIQRTRS